VGKVVNLFHDVLQQKYFVRSKEYFREL